MKLEGSAAIRAPGAFSSGAAAVEGLPGSDLCAPGGLDEEGDEHPADRGHIGVPPAEGRACAGRAVNLFVEQNLAVEAIDHVQPRSGDHGQHVVTGAGGHAELIRLAHLFRPERPARLRIDGVNHRLVGNGVQRSLVQDHIVKPTAALVEFDLRGPRARQAVAGGCGRRYDIAPLRRKGARPTSRDRQRRNHHRT